MLSLVISRKTNHLRAVTTEISVTNMAQTIKGRVHFKNLEKLGPGSNWGEEKPNQNPSTPVKNKNILNMPKRLFIQTYFMWKF